MVAPARPRSDVNGGQDGVDLFTCQETEQRLGASFFGNRQDPLSRDQKIWGHVIECETSEGTNRRQTMIASACLVLADRFEMVEEGEDRLGGKCCDGKLIDGFTQPGG